MRNMPCQMLNTVKSEHGFQYSIIGNYFAWDKTSNIEH